VQANAVVSGAGHQGERRSGAWLLSHDSPCLRARTKQWLLELPADDPSVEADRREYRRDPVLARLFAAQAPDGSWHGPALYCPKHRSTFWTLAVLAEMGAGRWLDEVEKAAEFALQFQAANGEVYQFRRAAGGRPSPQKPVPCATTRLMSWLAELGYAGDERLLRAVDYLISTQRPDGGWSCMERAMPRGLESEKPCLGVTASFLALAEAVPALARHQATARAVELVVSLYFKDPKGYHVGNSWPYLYYPCFFMDLANTGRLLLVLAGDGGAGAGGGEVRQAITRGAEYLVARRLPDGAWPSDGHPYRPPVDPGKKGKGHPWVTLRVLRFLKAAGKGAAGHLEG